MKVIPIANENNITAKNCTCEDYDEDCEDVQDKTVCWLYMPEKGMCPYLDRSE